MITYPLSPRLATARYFLPGPAVELGAQRAWQRVHQRLLAHQAAGVAPASLADLTVYIYAVGQAFGRAEDTALARHLAQQLLNQPWPQTGCRWTVSQVKQACALAWLHARGAVAPPAGLDEALYQEAQYMLAQGEPGYHELLLLHLVRYLGLRLPAPSAARYLRALLAQWPTAPARTSAEAPLTDLDALAAELLTLIWVDKIGLSAPAIPVRVRQGVRQLLASRRAVDFQEQRYSIFPYRVCLLENAGDFDAKLTWCRGDARQALLLYEAHSLLQDKELISIAELVGLNTTLRTSVAATEVSSAGFCHGAAGIAQLYSRLYSVSGQQAYRTAYHFWLSRTQELLLAEIPGWLPPASTESLADAAGVALVLLTATQQTAIDWEALLA